MLPGVNRIVLENILQLNYYLGINIFVLRNILQFVIVLTGVTSLVHVREYTLNCYC